MTLEKPLTRCEIFMKSVDFPADTRYRNMKLFRAMYMFHKYVKHACMHEHILEHVYGEKPYMSKRKAS